MCGIVGYWNFSGGAPEEMEGQVLRMASRLESRGPDDAGAWVDGQTGVALGHRRLSIIDTSSAGHQPMLSRDGRWVLSYNGEIYNAVELRRELDPERFTGHSDTEVLVEAVARWGVDATVARLVGMFAFALWDRHRRELHLVRDRLGIKPLYWSRQGRRLFFGSQLKALAVHPGFRASIDRAALVSYMRLGYINAPHSIFEGVHKLSPGCMVTISAEEPERCAPRRYWDLARVAAQGTLQGSDEELMEGLDARLRQAVGRRMIADVPLGAFLSGGIDSSLVVALMQQLHDRPIDTFTIGFETAAFDESDYARRVAQHLGCRSHIQRLHPRQALELVPQMPEWYDEPFADSSQLPTTLVSRFARQHVTVVLTGDGGDECFGGYHRYWYIPRLQRARALLGPRGRALSVAALRAMARRQRAMPEGALPSWWAQRISTRRLDYLASVLEAPDDVSLVLQMASLRQRPGLLVPGADEARTSIEDPALRRGASDELTWLQLVDLHSYLPDDILTKIDRATMSIGLEGRVPLLDHQVVEYAVRLPRRMKIRQGHSKWALRQILHRHVPAELFERPKAGFAIPLSDWLRGDLRDWASDLLASRQLREEGGLDLELVQRDWRDHVTGAQDRRRELWPVLMFASWLHAWKQRPLESAQVASTPVVLTGGDAAQPAPGRQTTGT